MIRTVLDLADVLATALGQVTAGEAQGLSPIVARFITPPQASFAAETVEGKKFLVTVSQF